ncbi:Uncharacterised protein [Mycobacteroides abscessus subsp. abscessus]|nr:Uncharacterised protein [Mycobacteroides abscessus subsp. abscessus]
MDKLTTFGDAVLEAWMGIPELMADAWHWLCAELFDAR